MGLNPLVSDAAGLGWKLSTGVSNKSPGAAAAGGLEAMLEIKTYRTFPGLCLGQGH